MGKTDWLDGKHVVFGSVTGGMDVVKAIEAVGSQSGKTSKPVVIADCGQLSSTSAVEVYALRGQPSGGGLVALSCGASNLSCGATVQAQARRGGKQQGAVFRFLAAGSSAQELG